MKNLLLLFVPLGLAIGASAQELVNFPDLPRLLCCRRFRTWSMVALTILCLSSFQLLGQTTSAGEKALIVPPLVNYSGVLQDSAGKPLSGAVSVTFSIYKDSQGGTPLWAETQNLQADGSGHYSVMLGSTTNSGLPEDLFAFGQPRWIGLQAQGVAEQPRALLVAVPYALKASDAATIGGLPPSAFLRATPEETSSTGGSGPPSQIALSSSSHSNTGKSAPPLNSPCSSLSGGGTTNFLPMWTSGCSLHNSTVFQSGGLVGIGTITPGATLTVAAPNQAGIYVQGPYTGVGAGMQLQTTGATNPLSWEVLATGQLSSQGYGKLNFRASPALGQPSDILTIDQNGKVGINQTKPTATLDIKAPNESGLLIEASVLGVGSGMVLKQTGTSPHNWQLLATGNSAAQATGKFNIRETTSSTDALTIDTGAALGTGTRCASPGTGVCVGINNIVPKAALDVVSPVNGRNAGYFSGDVYVHGKTISDQDLINVTAASGVILKSSGGSCFRYFANDDGSLGHAPIFPCPTAQPPLE